MRPDRRHVLILNQYAPPDPASTGKLAFEVARALAAQGTRVTFLAGQPSYVSGQRRAAPRELVAGVEVVRLRIAGRGGRTTRLRRFSGYISYLLAVALASVRLAGRDRIDTVVAFHNPPLLPALAAALLGRRRRLVCVVMDIHPDVLLATGWISLPTAVVGLWNRVNRWTFRRADTIVVISEGMKAVMREKGVPEHRIVVIPLWAEPELSPEERNRRGRQRHGIEPEELLLLFTGNMGVTQQLEPVRAAAELLARAPVRFCFVGGGVQASSWQAQLAALPNTMMLPFQNEPDYRELVLACDVGVVTLAPGLEQLVVPSRAFPFLSAGIPLLAVMSPASEVGELIRGYRCGVCVESAEQLVSAVERWLGDPTALRTAGVAARAAYEATRSRDLLIRRYAELC
jgi:colanic acid biosynthesis glycosyl transferase WcaI